MPEKYGIRPRGIDGYCVVHNESGRIVPGGCYAARDGAVEHAQELNLHDERSGQRDLTDREMQIAKLLVTGMTDREVAACLSVQYDTVRQSSSVIQEKLGVGRKAGLLLALILKGHLRVEDMPKIRNEAIEVRCKLHAVSP